MKKLIYSILFTFLAVAGWSQSEQLFTHYMFNRMNFNPAVAGSKNVLDVGAIYRNQWWSGIDGSPKTLNAYGHMPFAGGSSGIGLNLISDKIGLDKIFSFGANYAYRIKFKNNHRLALGLGARFENAKSDWGKTNEQVDVGDNTIGTDVESKSTFNIGPGVYYNSKKFYLGVSIPRILSNSLYKDSKEFKGNVNTYYIQGGFEVPLSRNVSLQPNAQIHYNPHAPFDFDANLNFEFYRAFLLGINYRYEDSVDGLIGYRFSNGLKLGVALDFTISDLSKATTGSYEIFLGYTFPCEDCEIKNLRYF